jgi:hypothetical protein
MDGIAVDGDGAEAVTLAEGRSDKGCERDGRVVGFEEFGEDAFVTAIATHDLEGFGGATLGEGGLAEHKSVEDGDRVAGFEQLGDENGTEISGTAGDENFHGYVGVIIANTVDFSECEIKAFQALR